MGEKLKQVELGLVPITWEMAAKRLGELLSDVGPECYYDMTPEQWFLWAADGVKKLRNSGKD